MRSLITSAGPVKDGGKRYKNIKDGIKDQDLVVTRFQQTLRSMAEGDNSKYANVRTRILATKLYNAYF